MKWLVLLLAVLFGSLTLTLTLAQAQARIEIDDVRLELELEPRPHASYPGEMILLSIHGTYKIPVIRENLLQPSLENFDWMQLGEDRWYKARENGFEVLKLERRMALFPQNAGRLEIPAFTHALEMLGRNGQTVPVDISSNALSLKVVPRPDTVDWWFPVRGLEISDSWSNQPEALDTGAAALRIVTLTVDGSAPQRIPPMPEMTGAGAFIFPHPEQKITALGPDGPITRVFWRWTVRPDEGSAGYLNPVRIAWFDTETRESRDIELSAQRIAYAEGSQEVRARVNSAGASPSAVGEEDGWNLPALPGWAVLPSGILGLLIGLALLVWRHTGAVWALPRWLWPDPRLVHLKRAARNGNGPGVWAAAVQVLGTGKPRPQSLRQLERAIFGRDGSQPDLRDVARAVRSAATAASNQPP